MFTCPERSCLGLATDRMEERRAVPTVPAGVSRGCWHTRGRARPVESSVVGLRAVAAHLLGERGDVDRLLEEAGEPSASSQRRRRCNAAQLRATTGMRAVRAPSRSARATSLPSMSGRPRSSKITSGMRSRRERYGARPLAASIVRSPAARSTSCASFRFVSLSSTMRTSGQRSGVAARAPGGSTSSPYPHAVTIRIVVAEDQYLVREGLRRLLETRDDLEVVSVCGDLDSLLAAVDAERPDVVVTDIRMPPGEYRRGNPGRHAAARDEPRGRRRRAEPVRRTRATCSHSSRAAASGARTS